MARPRKVHVQTAIAFPRVDKNGGHRGGPRPNAGRKPALDAHDRARMSHAKRPNLDQRNPQHITLRVSSEVGWLRQLDIYAAIKGAMRAIAKHADEFRIAHYSVENTHIHLITEAASKAALGLGLRAFQISAAKRINATVSRRRRYKQRRRGAVFTDRYHVEPLGSPRQVRNALAYVLNNWRRHRVERDTSLTLADGQLDPFASGLAFAGWREQLSAQRHRQFEPPPVSNPRTWLLAAGWKKAPSISCFEVPGPRPRQRAATR